ncbi:hypothetical protein [Parasitella parasitica]|uniref:Uncharacterized protein n=1 Tax=Parasitella parasitica TaxID=35722 RepID=A0A0B7N4H1_9FUNG|nr:hypothetical protein [Parasitella parasitica]
MRFNYGRSAAGTRTCVKTEKTTSPSHTITGAIHSGSVLFVQLRKLPSKKEILGQQTFKELIRGAVLGFGKEEWNACIVISSPSIAAAVEDGGCCVEDIDCDAETLALGEAKEKWVDNVDAEFPSLPSGIVGAGAASVDVEIDGEDGPSLAPGKCAGCCSNGDIFCVFN